MERRLSPMMSSCQGLLDAPKFTELIGVNAASFKRTAQVKRRSVRMTSRDKDVYDCVMVVGIPGYAGPTLCEDAV